MGEGSNHCNSFIFQIGLKAAYFFSFNMRSSSRNSLVRILSTSSSKGVLRPSCFDRVYLKSSSLCSTVYIVSTSYSKNGLMLTVFAHFLASRNPWEKINGSLMLRGMSKPQKLLKSFQDVLSVFRVLVYYF